MGRVLEYFITSMILGTCLLHVSLESVSGPGPLEAMRRRGKDADPQCKVAHA